MKKLAFVNSWGNIKAAWSGTPNGLYTALSRKMEIMEINCFGRIPKFLEIYDLLTMGIRKINTFSDALNNADIPDDTSVFMFGEYSSKYANRSYVYQDLSVDYLLRLRQQKHPVANWGLNRLIPTYFARKKNAYTLQFYKNCAGIFTMSEWLKTDLVQNTGVPEEKVHYVGGGCSVDTSRIDYSKKCGNRFLFIGKDWERKNGPLVVEAFKKLSSMLPEMKVELYIVGPTEQPECTRGQENIVFLGRLSYDALVDYYNMCDYFVMPSKFEAYGLVFVEALCFGLPCIGKNICAMPEFIQEGENGYLIENDDVDELANAMSCMLKNGEYLAKNVQNKRECYINKYSWDSVADRIIQVVNGNKTTLDS